MASVGARYKRDKQEEKGDCYVMFERSEGVSFLVACKVGRGVIRKGCKRPDSAPYSSCDSSDCKNSVNGLASWDEVVMSLITTSPRLISSSPRMMT